MRRSRRRAPSAQRRQEHERDVDRAARRRRRARTSSSCVEQRRCPTARRSPAMSTNTRDRREPHQPADDDHRDLVHAVEESHDGAPPLVARCTVAAAAKMQTAMISGSRSPRPAPPPRTDSAGSCRRASARTSEQRSRGGRRRPSAPTQRVAIGLRTVLLRRARHCATEKPDRSRRPTSCRGNTPSVLPPIASERAHVAERRDADEDAGDHERHDDHRDQTNERRPDRLERDEHRLRSQCRRRRAATSAPTTIPPTNADEDLRLELHRRDDGVVRFASASRTRVERAIDVGQPNVAHVPDAKSRRLVRTEARRR